MQNIKLKLKLSVVIVAYNSEDFIKKCISSLLKNLPDYGEIIVLDNGSEDRTFSILQEFKSQINLIQSDKNLGFGKGNNLAAKKAQGSFLFFLNPDTQINQPLFQDLIKFYEEHPDAGIVAPALVMPDGKIQSSVKNLPTVPGAFREYILGVKNAYSEYVPDNEKPEEVEAVYAAAILIKKDLFEKLHGFDEKYFMYYEDIDLCKRIGILGRKIYYFPSSRISHLVGGTKSKRNKYELNLTSSKLYHGLLGSLLLQIIFRLHQIFS